MKPYLAFSYADYYPVGAKSDFIGDFETLNAVFESKELSYHENLDILDTVTGEWHEFIRSNEFWERVSE